jgi:hypothetical protein
MFLGVSPSTTSGSVPLGIAFVFVAASGVEDGLCINVGFNALMDRLAPIVSFRFCGLEVNRGYPPITRLVSRLLSL